MQGNLTTRHLMTNAPTIIHEFGMYAFVRCLASCVLSKRDQSFVELVMRLHRA